MRHLLVLVMAGVAFGGGNANGHAWDDAVEVAHGNFVVRTNTFPQMARALAERLDEATIHYEDRFGPLEGAARLPMRLELFATRDDYREHGDGVEGAVGHFDSARDRCAIAWRGGLGATGWPVAVHEGCHHYFRRRFPTLRTPSWYSEGIACYFEGLLDPTTVRRVSRLRIGAARAALADGQADLETVLAAQARVSAGELTLDRFKPSRFYGLAWSLIHFLANDPRYTERFRLFELRLFASRPLPSRVNDDARRLLLEECGSLATLERHWIQHVRGLPVPPPVERAAVYAWELASPDAWVRYGAVARLASGPVPADLRDAAIACLRDPDTLVRGVAIRLVANHMTPEAVPAMVALLDAGDAEYKGIALRALAMRGAGLAVPRLLTETDERDAALRALAVIGDPRAFPALREALVDPLRDVRTRAACATALAGDPGARKQLERAAADAAPRVRNAARNALARWEEAKRGATALQATAPGADRVRAAIATLRDPLTSVREKRLACTVVTLARSTEAVPALRALCASRHPDTMRIHAVRALVRITGETRGFVAGQRARAREAAYRAWAPDGRR